MLARFRRTRSATPPAPIFIIGSPRSGTSMLHWALLQHESLWGSEESEFLLPIARAIGPAYAQGMRFKPHSWLHQQDVDLNEFAAYIGAGLNDLYVSRSDGMRWVEQTPSYSIVATELALLFPTAQFLHIIRDGRQVVDSMRRMWNYTLTEAAHQWRDHVRGALELEQQHAKNVLRINYEKLVSDPNATFQQIFAFLDLSPTDAAVAFVQDKPINVAPGTEEQPSLQKLQPRWHGWSTDDQSTFNEIAGQLLARLEYS